MRSRRDDSRSGSILTEFALVVPLFLLLCVGAVDFSRVFYATMVLTGATRAGVEYAAQNGSNSAGITGAVTTAAGNLSGLNVSTSQFCTCSIGGAQVACSSNCSGKATYVQVTSTVPFRTVSAWPLVPNTITISTSGAVRVQ